MKPLPQHMCKNTRQLQEDYLQQKKILIIESEASKPDRHKNITLPRWMDIWDETNGSRGTLGAVLLRVGGV